MVKRLEHVEHKNDIRSIEIPSAATNGPACLPLPHQRSYTLFQQNHTANLRYHLQHTETTKKPNQQLKKLTTKSDTLAQQATIKKARYQSVA
jgi:hypothetical protein